MTDEEHDQLMDEVYAQFREVIGERPDLAPDDLVAIIATRMGPQVELALAADAEPGTSPIRDLVHSLLDGEDAGDDSPRSGAPA